MQGVSVTSGAPWYRDRRIIAWALYDFANTPFVLVIGTVGFPTYFKEVVLEGTRSGDFLWGLTGSVSMILVVLTAPAAGAYADQAGAKRRLLLAYTAVAVVCTALLVTVGVGMVVWAMALVIVANVGFQGGQVFYNAFLPEITEGRDMGTVSGVGFAAGYVGALISMLIALPFLAGGYTETNVGNARLLFAVVALWWGLLSIPTFVLLRDRPHPAATKTTGSRGAGQISTASLRRPFIRMRDLRRHRNTFRFLLAFFFYTDAMTTMVAFVAIYARETLGLSFTQIVLLYILSEITAIPGSYALGRLADRTGAKPTLIGILILWLVILALGALARDLWLFAPVAMLAGVGTGALQSVSRSMMAQLAPRDREGEFFGFYTMAGRISAILGPLIFGAVSSISGNQRFAIASLMALMAAGLLVLRTVDAPPSVEPAT
jgi:UMF1 family MFS transporter